jgi:signal transduction histidine kinase
VNPLRSVGGKLALALVLVVTGALAIVYWIVVPSYRQSLIDAKVSQLGTSLEAALPTLPSNRFDWQDWADEQVSVLRARVVVYDFVDGDPPLLLPAADSNPFTSTDIDSDPLGLRAGRNGVPVGGTVERGGNRYAEAAIPLIGQGVVVMLSAPLADQLETAALVRRRVFVAGGLGIAFSVLLGYVLAGLLGRRIRRLEVAAERIADGRFDEPVIDYGSDELGQLARAFERMRLRLAHLDRARGEFIANASHELRTPLFSLGGFLELLDDEELDDDTRAEFMAAMREQVARLTKLATDLLDLSRMDAGRLGVAEESLDLAQLVDEIAAEFRPRALAGEHRLEGVGDAAVPARGDAERVVQIGRILVENALVHTPPGTTVRVSAALDGSRATLTVADDGRGIPPEAQNQIFERFYRLDGTLASGSGLGLAIARELAELMGGRIELDSRDGWTLFTLVLGADVPDREPEALFA